MNFYKYASWLALWLSLLHAQEGIPAAGAAQIRALLQEKALRTPAQKKLDSQIHYMGKVARGQTLARGIPSLPSVRASVESTNGWVHVDIEANVNPALVEAIEALGGQVESSLGKYNLIQAWLPLRSAEPLAARSDVRFIRPAEMLIPNSRRANLRAGLARWLPHFVGPVDSSGVKAHGADIVHGNGITGAGVKVGVLSNGMTTLAAEQAAGRLPAVTVIPGQGNQGMGPCPAVPPPDQTGNCPDEGTAMLEVIHAMAPNAQLYFATAYPTQAQFATNILALRAAGCDILVDDVKYIKEPVFQDGIVAQAINAVTAAGAIYLSAAGDGGHLDGNQSGTWEGDYAAGASFPLDPGVAHNFGPASYNVLTGSLRNEVFWLQWADPAGASCNDYDLFILTADGNIVLGASTNTQDCTQDPFEALQGTAPPNARIVIVNYNGAQPRALHLDTSGGLLSIMTEGNIAGHNGAANAISVGAVAAGTALGGLFTGGTANPLESFSSDGPRKIFYDPDGNPITPGNFLFATNGGTSIAKVDLLAADGIGTGAAGFGSFYGASSAAPHAAAIAALVKSANPALTAAQVKNAMLSTALPVSNFQSRTSGAGIVMANRAVPVIGGSVLSVTQTHVGAFTSGQTGVYTITVSNGSGAGPTSGTVTVTESVPAGETLISMAGNGWTCPGTAANNCTRTDALAGGASYPPITVTVNVAANASSPQLNGVSVSGGGSAAANAVDATVITTTTTPPALGITLSHVGNFTSGQTGVYTIVVRNGVAAGPTAGTVTVTENLPAGETLISMAGNGWTCPGSAANNCTRTDALAGGASYSPITVTVNVAANASSPQLNVVSVSGGGAAAVNAVDATAINAPSPALSITKAHSGNFTLGQTGIYTAVVSNAAGAGPTSGTVIVTETVPPGETLVWMGGSGWTCPGTAANDCTRSDALAGGSSYPPITVMVNVSANASSPQLNVVSVSGGGSAAASAVDPTTVNAPMLPAFLRITKNHAGNFTQGQTGAMYVVTVSNAAGAGPTNGLVTVTDGLPAGLTLVSMAGPGWTCPGTEPNNCTRSDVLAPGLSYPPITVTVNVAGNAQSGNNIAVVNGGGANVSSTIDPTTIVAGLPATALSPEH